MGAGAEDLRQRHLATIASLENVSVGELEVPSSETPWLWLLNAGDMAFRARTGRTKLENLPGNSVDIVEILRKPYAIIQYASPEESERAMEANHSDVLLAHAAPAIVDRILKSLEPVHPERMLVSDDPVIYEYTNGLVLVPEFITEAEEAEMIHEYKIAASSHAGASLKRGAVHFGPHFDYTTFAVSTDLTSPPEYLTRLLPRLPVRNERDVPDQYTLQFYPPGTGIPPHVDTHSAFEESIYSLSFGASTRMQFKLCGEKEARRLRLPKRSLASGSSPRNESPAPMQDAGGRDGSQLSGSSPAGRATRSDHGQGAEEKAADSADESRQGQTSTSQEYTVEDKAAARDAHAPTHAAKVSNRDDPSRPALPSPVVLEEDAEWELELPPRSLLVMRGASRYGYSHGIKGRKYDQEGTRIVAREDRYSLTMRKCKKPEEIGCDCAYGHVCS